MENAKEEAAKKDGGACTPEGSRHPLWTCSKVNPLNSQVTCACGRVHASVPPSLLLLLYCSLYRSKRLELSDTQSLESSHSREILRE